MAIKRAISSSIQSGLPNFDSFWDGTSAVGAMEAISSMTAPSGGLSSIEFNNIPQTYTHLQLYATYQIASSDVDFGIRFNADAGSNYTKHQLYYSGAAVGSGVEISKTAASAGISYSSTASAFSFCITDILNYTNTNFYKTTRTLSGREITGGGSVFFRSAAWVNSNAITSITIVPFSGGTSINQYSTFALYGVK